MENEEAIKKRARDQFELGNYEDAFTIILEELDIDSFLAYVDGKKRQWLTDKHVEAAAYFWNTFALKEDNFQALFSSKIAVELLYIYYSRTTIFSKSFELKFSKTFPELFVKVIRLNQVFFKKERLDFLLNEVVLPEELEVHQDVWKYFYDSEIGLWEAILEEIKNIVSYSLSEILVYVVYYLEKQSYKNDTRVFITQLANVYSFFMELLLAEYDVTGSNMLDDEDFFKSFVEPTINKEESDLKKLIFKILNLIYNRSILFTNFIEPYSFESDVSPEVIYESLHFITKPEAHYRWQLDGIRYNANDLYYRSKGINFVQEKIDNEECVFIGKTKESQEFNKTLEEKVQSVLKVLSDLQLSKYYLNNTDTIEVSKIIHPIFTFAYNRFVKYQLALDEIKNSDVRFQESWEHAFNWLNMQSVKKGIVQMPFVYMTKKEYAETNKKAIPNFDDRITDIIIDSFGYTIKNTEPFDRFNINYNVFSKPFLILNNYIFSPVQFFVSFSYMYVYVDALIKNNGRKTAKSIEKYLMILLEAHNFNVFVPSKEQERFIQGDADIIVYDDNNVLLMQLKRTYLRVNPKDVYNEYLKTDIGGAKQLNTAEAFFKTENDIFEIKDRKVTKWIVSSSLENVNKTIDGCLKVNYMDIVGLLFNQEGMTFKTLDDFIAFYSKDYLMKVYLDNINDPYVIEQARVCIVPLFDYDAEKSKKYRYLYNKGLNLNRDQKNKQSIATFKKCLYYAPNDIEVHDAIANVYADIRNYEKAFDHFEKALGLLPNDPFITRNYIGTLVESGNFIKAKELTKELVEKYPLLKDIQELAKHILRTLPL